MIVFHTLTADRKLIAVHQTEAEAVDFAFRWNEHANRVLIGDADFVAAVDRDTAQISEDGVLAETSIISRTALN